MKAALNFVVKVIKNRASGVILSKSRLTFIKNVVFIQVNLSFSKILETRGRRDIGLFFIFSLDPFSYNGFNNAILYLSGNVNSFERLHKFLIGFAKTTTPSFKNLPPMLSMYRSF